MGKLTDAVTQKNSSTVKKLLTTIPSSLPFLGGYKDSPLIDTELNTDGLSALNIAVSNELIEIIKLLLKSGARVDYPNKFETTSLHIAIQKGRLNILEILLTQSIKPFDINQPDKLGITLLHLALYFNDVEAVKILIKYKANIEVLNSSLEPPLFVAARNNYIDIVKVLKEKGANINGVGPLKKTPLWVAAEKGCEKTVEMLISFGAEIDKPDQHGATPLWIAVYNGRAEVTKILLDANANINIEVNMLTLWNIAQMEGHTTIIKLLEENKNLNPNTKNMNPLYQEQENYYLKKWSTKPIKFGILQTSLSVTHKEMGIIEELGKGVFGKVYQGTWQKHIPVAIKKLNTMLPEDVIKDFVKEIEIMAPLDSPYLVKLYGICFETPCIIMEYMRGGSLDQLLHSEKLIDHETQEKIAYDIICGIAYLHEKNILHRDIKSMNVLLDSQHNAKLCDFGLSKRKNDENIELAGTPAWVAPELIENLGNNTKLPKPTKACDIYSFGMTLWELYARKIPYENIRTTSEIFSWITEGNREKIPKNTPPKMAKLITLCWGQIAEKRPNANVLKIVMEDEKFKAYDSSFGFPTNSKQ